MVRVKVRIPIMPHNQIKTEMAATCFTCSPPCEEFWYARRSASHFKSAGKLNGVGEHLEYEMK
jgi:hypothetical protein